jgi:hypothetical protein
MFLAKWLSNGRILGTRFLVYATRQRCHVLNQLIQSPIYKKRVASANKVAANLAKAIDCQRCREGLEVSLLSHYCNVFNNNKASWPF